MNKTEEMPSKTAIYQHLRQMMATEGWRILVVHFNAERERLIDNGKKGRGDEKGQKLWAALDGFDRAVLLPEKLLKLTKPLEDSNQEGPPLEEE